MTYLVDHYESVISAFESVLMAMKQLCLHIHDDLIDYPAWVDNGSQAFVSDRDKIIYALQHFSPVMSLTPQETFNCPGVVACTEQTFTLIDEVNRYKDEFRGAAQVYLDVFKANPTKTIRGILASAGYGAVMLKQVYRHIHKISFHPRRITWTKTQTASHKIINKEEASQRLLKLGGEQLHTQIQLSKLNLLPYEARLVIYHPIKPCWLANIATFKLKNEVSKKSKIKSSLPIFYLHEADISQPKVYFSKKIEINTTKSKSNKLLEDKPFLKSIRAYRYKLGMSMHL